MPSVRRAATLSAYFTNPSLAWYLDQTLETSPNNTEGTPCGTGPEAVNGTPTSDGTTQQRLQVPHNISGIDRSEIHIEAHVNNVDRVLRSVGAAFLSDLRRLKWDVTNITQKIDGDVGNASQKGERVEPTFAISLCLITFYIMNAQLFASSHMSMRHLGILLLCVIMGHVKTSWMIS